MVGDLSLDGVVDLKDFLLLADNFGEAGPPDTLRIEIRDMLNYFFPPRQALLTM